jgi:hypothetical protein
MPLAIPAGTAFAAATAGMADGGADVDRIDGAFGRGILAALR